MGKLDVRLNASALAQSYEDKGRGYFDGADADIVDRLPQSRDARILEIGCARGGTGELALARGKCRDYVGVELHEPSAMIARTRLSEVITGDVETMALPFEEEAFDVVVVSEVFEHLTDPWRALEKIARHLKPGGRLFASSPNVSHYRVIAQLLSGEWRLTERGVMDRTHLRWFTPRSYAEMVEAAGFDVEEIGPLTPPARRVRLINAATGGRFRHLFWVQINLSARKR
ncbi:MAG: class I SAM-dependent methyltransferase [Pseudomonadota bacterium]